MVSGGGASFPKGARIRRRSEFLNLSRKGKRINAPNFLIITRPNSRGETRLGITVSGKVGNAVVRNRVKRLIRECFRQYRNRIMPSKDVLIIARKGAANLSFTQVESELKNAVIESGSR
jgi:ribonuclease P protein component